MSILGAPRLGGGSCKPVYINHSLFILNPLPRTVPQLIGFTQNIEVRPFSLYTDMKINVFMQIQEGIRALETLIHAD